MLRAGKAKPQIETWPKAKKMGEVTLLTKANDDSDDSDREDKAFVPVFQSSFGDAIEQALNKFKKLGWCSIELFWLFWTKIVCLSTVKSPMITASPRIYVTNLL